MSECFTIKINNLIHPPLIVFIGYLWFRLVIVTFNMQKKKQKTIDQGAHFV